MGFATSKIPRNLVGRAAAEDIQGCRLAYLSDCLCSRGPSVTPERGSWSSGRQVVIQVKGRRLDVLGAQEDGDLGRVAHLVKHDIPQQVIHAEAFPWPVVHGHNPF